MEIGSSLVESLGIAILEPLGGRQNVHWAVERRGERMVLRRWNSQLPGGVDFELDLLRRLADAGCPVAVFEVPVEWDGYLWSLSPFLKGEVPGRSTEELRAQGRWMAELHAATGSFGLAVQRPGWRRFDEILLDEALDATLAEHESIWPEEILLARGRLDQARRILSEDGLSDLGKPVPIHGDFAPWNLRVREGRLAGVLDFELSRLEFPIADFALAWRGKYYDLILGYQEVRPLSEAERAMIAPAYWATLLDVFVRDLRTGLQDSWTVAKLALP